MDDQGTTRTDVPPVEPPPERRRPPVGGRARRGFLTVAGALGIVGIGTAIAAILGTQDVEAWVVGTAVACVSLLLVWLLRRAIIANERP